MSPNEAVTASCSVVLELDGLQWASAKSAVEATLGRRPGVLAVTANPAGQTATVVFDPTVTDVPELASWVRQCGLHCRGESVPDHLCAAPAQDSVPGPGERSQGAATARPDGPVAEQRVDAPKIQDRTPSPAHEGHVGHGGHEGHDMAAVRGMAGAGGDVPDRVGSPADVMGHGGHGEMSMAGMVRDMRDRFFVAALFGIVITLWSRIGREVLHFTVAAPFGLRDDVFQLVLSLPVIFYSAQVFFAGAVQALRARTLDMMVLVAVAVGAGWVYSVGVTVAGGGDVF